MKKLIITVSVWVFSIAGLSAQSVDDVVATSKLRMMQNEQEVELFFSNYIEMEWIKFSMNMEISTPIGGIITVDTQTVKLNTSVDENIFKMPTTKN